MKTITRILVALCLLVALAGCSSLGPAMAVGSAFSGGTLEWGR